MATLWLVAAHAMAGPLEEGDKALREERWADAYRLLSPEAENGQMFAQYSVALLLHQGLGVPKDLTRAAKLYEKAAAQGDNDAKVNLGQMYATGEGVPRDPKKAVTLYRAAADAGNAMGQNNLASAYLNGDGVEKSNAEAVRWYTKAAEQDLAMAQNSLGSLYCHGRPAPDPIGRNGVLCMQWLGRAADLGYAPARQNIFDLTKEMAQGGSVEAMHNLGAYYLRGIGTERNASLGLQWITRAAEAGKRESQLILAQLYETGAFGVAADAEKAALWKKRAGK